MQDQQSKIHARCNLGFHCFRCSENMRVVLRKATHAQEAMHHARTLVTINSSKFREAQGQFAIAAERVLVDEDVEGAIHGFQLVFCVFQLNGRKHILAIKIRMAARLPQVHAQHAAYKPGYSPASEVPLAENPQSLCGPGYLWDARRSALDRLPPGC